MPLAIEQLDVSAYDLVLSSSYAVAKGVLTGPEQLHVCYCHSPMRYAWDLQHEYLRETGLGRGVRGAVARWLLHRLRVWDGRSASGVDQFIANSRYIARRIEKTYRRESAVIYPPVDIDFFTPGEAREDFFLIASRMVPYKRIDLIVDAFAAMPERRLIVVGDGPEGRRLRSRAAANVRFTGQLPREGLRDHLRRARAFVFAAREDFGIAPLEAQACGTPVIAYGKGGARETIAGLECPRPTGVFFQEQSVPAVCRAVATFEREAARLTPDACRENAVRFNPSRFRRELKHHIEQWSVQLQQQLEPTGLRCPGETIVGRAGQNPLEQRCPAEDGVIEESSG
jgi:glycosyltransferase involved in cell wall biosynthesis